MKKRFLTMLLSVNIACSMITPGTQVFAADDTDSEVLAAAADEFTAAGAEEAAADDTFADDTLFEEETDFEEAEADQEAGSEEAPSDMDVADEATSVEDLSSEEADVITDSIDDMISLAAADAIESEAAAQCYTINYVLNNGNNNSANPENYQAGTSTTLKDPAREGYTFAGWYTDAAFSNKFKGITASTKGNLTLYAKWNLNMTYDFPEGTQMQLIRAKQRLYTNTKKASKENAATDEAGNYVYLYRGDMAEILGVYIRNNDSFWIKLKYDGKVRYVRQSMEDDTDTPIFNYPAVTSADITASNSDGTFTIPAGKRVFILEADGSTYNVIAQDGDGTLKQGFVRADNSVYLNTYIKNVKKFVYDSAFAAAAGMEDDYVKVPTGTDYALKKGQCIHILSIAQENPTILYIQYTDRNGTSCNGYVRGLTVGYKKSLDSDISSREGNITIQAFTFQQFYQESGDGLISCANTYYNMQDALQYNQYDRPGVPDVEAIDNALSSGCAAIDCSAFTYSVYSKSGYVLPAKTRALKFLAAYLRSKNHSSLIYYEDSKEGNKEGFDVASRFSGSTIGGKQLQVGDLIIVRRENGSSSNEWSGHVMMVYSIQGDDIYLIHATGKSYNDNAAKDFEIAEPQGAVLITKSTDLFNYTSYDDVDDYPDEKDDTVTGLCVIRPRAVTAEKWNNTVRNFTLACKDSASVKHMKSVAEANPALIKPQGTSISQLKALSKGFSVQWKKRTVLSSGYQVQYSTCSTFKNGKTITVSGTKTTSRKVTKLKGKKKYYVRVRTFKTVSGKKYYSAWSARKMIRTKA